MRYLKKVIFTGLIFVSGTVVAGEMGGTCKPADVSALCKARSLSLDVQALYLQPRLNDKYGSYPILYDSSPIIADITYVNSNINWGWGFKIEGAYQFTAGDDVRLSWYHMHDNNTTTSYSGAEIFSALHPNFPDFYRSTAVTENPSWDAINVEFSHIAAYGKLKTIRLYAGGQYARIKSESNYTQSTLDGELTFQSNQYTYQGFGPRVGMDMTYQFWRGLSAYANGAMLLLAGTSSTDVFAVEARSPDEISTVYGNVRTIAPGLEGKLGLQYNYSLLNSELMVNAGYMWVNYFNALNLDSFTEITTDSSDFGLQGIYFGLKWVGTVA